jgi:hypothetical protein
MAQLKRNLTMGLIRTFAVLTVALAALVGVTGQAFAHDDNNDEVVTYGSNACTVVANLPVTTLAATCVEHKTELDDGVTETKNSYVTQASADAVQQAFNALFSPNSWTVVEAKHDLEDQEWEYTIVKAGRQVEIKVKTQDPDEGSGAEFSIAEK